MEEFQERMEEATTVLILLSRAFERLESHYSDLLNQDYPFGLSLLEFVYGMLHWQDTINMWRRSDVEKRQLSDDMTVLLMQLVAQNQLVMAGMVLKAYFLRLWKIDEAKANEYVRCYFNKFYPKLERHLKRLNRVI